jgi:hypothetical protein
MLADSGCALTTKKGTRRTHTQGQTVATPKGTRAQRFLLKPGDAVHIYSNSHAITFQLRHEVPTEVDLAATSFKAAVALTPSDALAIAGELLTAAAAQLTPKA